MHMLTILKRCFWALAILALFGAGLAWAVQARKAQPQNTPVYGAVFVGTGVRV